MKLELKHLAPYLPYRLKVKYLTSGDIEELEYLDVKNNRAGTIEEHSMTDEYYLVDDINNCKPILRPLSDLTEDNYPESLSSDTVLGIHEESIEVYSVLELPYHDVQVLLENHFDVFGLIPKDLAIYINTINK